MLGSSGDWKGEEEQDGEEREENNTGRMVRAAGRLGIHACKAMLYKDVRSC